MKKLLMIGLLVLCGCGLDTHVLTNDGSKDLGWCMGSDWVECINKNCPNGYDIVKKPSWGETGILKCKP
jgi:hypothetical protein